MKPALAFLAICIMGFFCAWIGGVEPFTAQAGAAAFGTLSMAIMGALFMWLYEKGI